MAVVQMHQEEQSKSVYSEQIHEYARNMEELIGEKRMRIAEKNMSYKRQEGQIS